MVDEDEKICFVIAPIGEEGSEERIRSDKVLKHIISPGLTACGYTPLRADEIQDPGIITTQVIQHVLNDPMVVADMTGWNPNVFYELAVRHMIKRPVVQIIERSERIPFDVAGSRTIQVDHHDLDSAAAARDQLTEFVKAAEKDPGDVDSPISIAVELQSLSGSDNPLEQSYAEILTILQQISGEVGDLKAGNGRGKDRVSPAAVRDLVEKWELANEAVAKAKSVTDSVPEQLTLELERVEDSIGALHPPVRHIARGFDIPPPRRG